MDASDGKSALAISVAATLVATVAANAAIGMAAAKAPESGSQAIMQIMSQRVNRSRIM